MTNKKTPNAKPFAWGVDVAASRDSDGGWHWHLQIHFNGNLIPHLPSRQSRKLTSEKQAIAAGNRFLARLRTTFIDEFEADLKRAVEETREYHRNAAHPDPDVDSDVTSTSNREEL